MNQNLNKEQKRAILHHEGPMMVLAGPGSGKTMVLTWRILCLLSYHHVEEDEILVLTYTKAAAQEMRSRFFRLIGTDQSTVHFGTIHSVCLELLKGSGAAQQERVGRSGPEEQQDLIGEEEAGAMIQEYLITREGLSRREAGELGMEILQYYSYLRNIMQEKTLFSEEKASLDPEGKAGLTRRTLIDYEEKKHEKGKMDFDDILTQMRQRLEKDEAFLEQVQAKYSFFLVDEFQDVCPLQYEIIKQMSRKTDNLFVVGDDDQAIYGFRGSQSAIMQQFPEDYPDCCQVILRVNYRSHEEIVRFAGAFILHNQVRYPKEIISGKEADDDDKKAERKKHRKRVRLNWSRSESGEGRAVASFLKKWQEEHKIQDEQEKGPKRLPQAAILLRTTFEALNYRDFLLDYGVSFEYFGECLGPYHHWIGENLWCVYRASQRDPKAQMKLFQMLYPKRSDAMFQWESSRKLLKEGKGDLLKTLKEQIRDDELYVLLSELDYELKKMASLKPVDLMDRFLDRCDYKDYLKEKAYKRKIPYRVLEQRLKFWREDLKGFDDFESWNAHRYWAMHNPDKAIPSIRFETMHSSKGLEYDQVVIPGIVKGRLPHPRNTDLEEERRLLYVAITRAKEGVYLSAYRTKEKQSVFWKELIEKKSVYK